MCLANVRMAQREAFLICSLAEWTSNLIAHGSMITSVLILVVIVSCLIEFWIQQSEKCGFGCCDVIAISNISKAEKNWVAR
jgi:hypothetical protein